MTAANATSYRKRFRYANELRRYSQTAKWATLKDPKPLQLLELTALEGGTVKLLVSKTSGYNGSLAPTVWWSLDGLTNWTSVDLTGWTAGATLLTTVSGLAAGLTYFTVYSQNPVNNGPMSNVKSVTVLA